MSRVSAKSAAKEEWRNRIIGHGEEVPDQLLANPNNWRVHPQEQRAALEGVLDEVGWVQDVVVNRTTGHLVDGHLRVSAALKRGEQSVPVVYVELTAKEEALVLASLDPMAAMAAADKEKLDLLLHEVETGSAGVQAMLADLAESEGLYFGENGHGGPATEDVEPQVNRAEELREKWQTETGQLWALGDHRLICGDCTDRAVVEWVMGGGKAEMVWTDPPYGVAVGDRNKYLNAIAPGNRVEENLENDTLDEPALRAMLAAAFDNAAAFCLAGGAWYVAAPPGPLHVVFGLELKRLGIWRQTIQWVKNKATFSPMGTDYHWQAEPIFYGWLPGAGHRYHGGRKQTTVWEIDKPMASPEHPTMKPVELVARAIKNSSLERQMVLDPFSGSGTALIACEQLDRQCRAIEISPAYVAVALERWSQATGRQPEVVE